VNSYLRLFMVVFTASLLSGLQAQVAAPQCNNEDFEAAGPAGPITSSTAINGWTVYKILSASIPSFPDNCQAFTSTAVPKGNPSSAALFTTNGYIDPVIGSGYTISSVFGSGNPNGGTSPGLGSMFGNNFLLVGGTASISFNHNAVEKTISVTQSNALFRFAYLPVVAQKVGSCCELPTVQYGFFNASQGNTLLPCSSYSVIAPSFACASPVNTLLTPVATSTQVFYHPWKIVAVDLSPYIGSNIVFKLATFYCSTGCLNYAYSYLDAQCSPMEIYVNGTPFPAHTNSVTFANCGVQSATVVAPPDFSSYQWTGPGGFSSTLSTISTSVAGVYTLNIAAVGTCSTITKYINLKLYPAPVLSLSSSNTLICRGKTATIAATGLSTYTWSIPASGGTIIVSPANTTTYTVSGYDANGCFASAAITQSVVSCVGVQEAGSEQAVLVYPNPARGVFHVQCNAARSGKFICLKNVLGQEVFRHQLESENTRITPQLPQGVYYYEVSSGGKPLVTGRLVLE